MAETRFIPSQRSGRAALLGQAIGGGLSSGIEDKLVQMLHDKADRVRSAHLKTLMPGASDEQVAALSHLGPNIYEPALRGGFGAVQQASAGQQLPQPNAPQMQNNDFQPLEFMKALSGFGLKMTPAQEQQFAGLAPDKQEQIAKQLFERLSPDQQDNLEKALFAQAQQPKMDQQPQQIPPQQQVVGSPQPGVGPQQQPMQQQPVTLAQSLQRGPSGEKQSVAQQLQREKFESAKEEKEQKRIKTENAPFTKQLEKEVPIAEKTLRLVNEMLDLESKNETPENIISRSAGAYLPGVVNPYNEYNAKSNEIAALKSQATGRPSVFMTQLQQSTKPNSAMPKEKRINLLNSLKENAEVILGVDEAARELIEQNDGKQIPNLKKHAEEKFFQGVLPPSSDYEINTEVEVYGEKFKNSPTGWKKIRG